MHSGDKQQPYIVVCLAIEAALAADDLTKLVNLWRPGAKLPRTIPVRWSAAQWVRLYRDHRRMLDRVTPLALPEAFQADAAPSEIADEVRAFFRLPAEQMAAELAKALKNPDVLALAREFGPQQWPPTRHAVVHAKHNSDVYINDTDPAFVEAISTAEGMFFLRVWLPCWIRHRMYPGQLFHKARAGDDDAFCDLLRMDKSVLADPVLADRWHRMMQDNRPALRKRLLDAMKGQPKTVTAKALRVGLAGLVSQLAAVMGTDVTEPQMRSMFDTVARVQSGRTLETGLPAGQEAFSKAIQRGRTWPSIPGKPDK